MQNEKHPDSNEEDNVQISKPDPNEELLLNQSEYSSPQEDKGPSYYIQKVVSMVSYEIKSGVIKPTKFDDAPQPVYGIAFRIRKYYSCDELEEGCGEFENSGRVIDCDIPRFRYVVINREEVNLKLFKINLVLLPSRICRCCSYSLQFKCMPGRMDGLRFRG